MTIVVGFVRLRIANEVSDRRRALSRFLALGVARALRAISRALAQRYDAIIGL
jgi:hypothetical protein